MVTAFFGTFKLLRLWALVAVAGLLTACDDVQLPSAGGGLGAALGGPAKVQVALLLPKTDGSEGVRSLAASAENAARLAMADLGGSVEMDLRVFDTKGDSATAAEVAIRAVGEGAQIIVGPLFAESAIAVGNAVAGSGVGVLTLSNTKDAAGGNVFLLGNTFENAANRLVSFAFSQGKKRAIIVHAKNVAGESGRNAIAQALAKVGAALAGVEGYDFTPDGVVGAAGRVAAKASATGSDVILMTAAPGDGDFAILAQVFPEAGVNPATVQYGGIARWDIAPSLFNLPGIQGGWFVMPNPVKDAQFKSRYRAAAGSDPHPLASLAYDGVAIAAAAAGRRNGLSPVGLTQSAGYQGANGIVRLLPNGLNQRGMAVGAIKGDQAVVISPAPESFYGARF